MTVLNDASTDLAQQACQNLPRVLINDLVYADDILVVGLNLQSKVLDVQVPCAVYASTGRNTSNAGQMQYHNQQLEWHCCPVKINDALLGQSDLRPECGHN